MKNPVSWIVLAMVMAVSSMVGLHWQEAHRLQARVARVETLAQREPIADHMILELERYRRLSGTFRKLTEAEIASTKTHLRNDISQGVSELSKLDPTAEESAIGEKLEGKVGDFMALSAKLEPQLFLRDVFLKQPARDLHESMVSDVVKLKKLASERAEGARHELGAASGETTRWLAALAASAVALVALLLLRMLLVYQRPLQRLRERAQAIREGIDPAAAAAERKPLGGIHGEVEKILTDLAVTADTLRKQRQQFVTAVASDLRAPLVQLQAGANLLASVADRLSPEQRDQAADAVNRSAYRLSRSLDDLSDIVDMDRSNIRLDEKIVDVRTVISDVAREIGGRGSSHPVEVSVPAAPIWTMMDPTRFERVIVHLLSKMMSVLPQGGAIHISVNRPTRGEFRGLEIMIQDAQRVLHGRGAATGPEQELLRHWVSQNGFGMALAQRIVQAHGGSISASGIAGTGVLFTLRLPQERVAGGAGGNASAVVQGRGAQQAQAGDIEISRLQTMFPEQAIHFGV